MKINLRRHLAEASAHFLAHTLPPRVLCSPRHFAIWEAKGYHIVPVHYESPIPASSQLRVDLWDKPSEMIGIEMRDVEQRKLLKTLSGLFKNEYDAFPRARGAGQPGFYLNNGWFEKVDAEILYSIVRYLRPNRMIEIGSGITTILSAAAIQKNEEEHSSYKCSFTCIEPYPVRLNPKTLPSNFNVVTSRAETVSLELFQGLAAGDILFIDSSHVCRTGSDVNWELLEILPRLSPGVWVHFHDIFLPWEYPRSWVYGSRRFLSEQYLLQAFIAFNKEFDVMWGSYYMLREHPEDLNAAFATFKVDITAPGTFLPGSFWIRRAS